MPGDSARPNIAASAPGRLAVTGPLTFATVRELAAQGDSLLAAQGEAGELEVDLQAVSSADSAGLALLIGWLARARRTGRGLRYAGIPERLLALARISEVEELLTGKAAAPSV